MDFRNEFWNNIIEPLMKEFNLKNTLEIGSNESNIYELLEYMLKVEGCLYCVDSNPRYDFKLVKNKFCSVYKHYSNFPHDDLLNLSFDLILINDMADFSKIIEYLKILDLKHEEPPIVLFQTMEIEKTCSKSGFFFSENKILDKFEKYVKESRNKNKLVFFKLNPFSGVGIVFPLEKIEKFQNVKFFYKEQLLYKKIKELKDDLDEKNREIFKKEIKFQRTIDELRDDLDEKNREIFKKEKKIKLYSNSLLMENNWLFRSLNEKIRNIIFNPYLFIVLKFNIHFQMVCHYIKAYNIIKDTPSLFDEKFYINEYPSVKLFKIPPLIHYMFYGYKEGKLANKYFEDRKFTEDAEKTDMNPLVYSVLFDKDTQNEIENITNRDKSIFKRLYKELLFIKNLKISIKVPASDEKEAIYWGDYHFALALKKEFERKNYKTKLDFSNNWDEEDDYDVALVLRGLREYKTKKNQINIMWNISHPNFVSLREYNTYDHVFIASDIFTNKMKKILKVPVSCLFQCTDSSLFYPKYDERYNHELLFVGIARKPVRKIIKDLLPTKRELGLYGLYWDDLLPKETITGNFIPNTSLNKAYSSCKILLNDHWENMRKNGFISNRIFDGFACGAFIISDNVEGAEFLKDALIVYETPDELKNLIDYYLENEQERRKKALAGKNIVLAHHTFEKRVKEILKVINDLNKAK